MSALIPGIVAMNRDTRVELAGLVQVEASCKSYLQCVILFTANRYMPRSPQPSESLQATPFDLPDLVPHLPLNPADGPYAAIH